MKAGIRTLLTSSLVIAMTCIGLPRMVSQVHAGVAGQHSENKPTDRTVRIQTERIFEFTVGAPTAVAAPLFGADKERTWAPGWNPAFVWPANVSHQRGTVFTVTRGTGNRVWITTAHTQTELFQHPHVTPEVVGMLITVKLTPHGSSTHAEGRYERTSLSMAANDMVQKISDHDGQSGPEWETQINEYPARSRK